MTLAASPRPLHLFSLPETLIPETPTVAHAKPLLRCHLPTEVSLVTWLTPPSINCSSLPEACSTDENFHLPFPPLHMQFLE